MVWSFVSPLVLAVLLWFRLLLSFVLVFPLGSGFVCPQCWFVFGVGFPCCWLVFGVGCGHWRWFWSFCVCCGFVSFVPLFDASRLSTHAKKWDVRVVNFLCLSSVARIPAVKIARPAGALEFAHLKGPSRHSASHLGTHAGAAQKKTNIGYIPT